MSVPVDRKMDKEDLMDLFRTFYQDNEFDMQSGVLAGWFGLPYRLEIGDEGRTDYPDLKGMFARGLSIPRTAYCIVAHPAPDEPVLYLAMDMPATSVFVPFLARTLTEASQETELEATMGYYASAYATGVRTEFSRESAWWAFDFVANWMTVNFRNMSVSYVYPAVAEWQPKALEAAAEHTTQAATAIQEALVEAWWALADKLVVRMFAGAPPSFPFPPHSSLFTLHRAWCHECCASAWCISG
jgi:dipeptidase